MTSAELAIIIKARDEASGVLNKLKATAGNVGSSMGSALKVGGLAAAAGIGAAGYALAGFVKDAMAEQVGIAQLTTAIATLDDVHRGSAAAVEEVVRAREKLAFSDDDLRHSLALLIPATGDYDEAVRRQSIAMDLARGTGLDLATTSRLLGKVTEESVNVFKRYGITIDKNATETEALNAVQAKFAGQSAAYAATAAGKWEIFGNQMDNIKESIGSALLPTVTKLGAALGDFLIAHQADIDRFAAALGEKIPKAIDSISRSLAPLVPHLKALAEDALQGWVTIFDTLQPQLKEFGTWLVDHRPVLIALAVALAGVTAILIGWPALIAAVLIGAGLLVTKLQEWRERNKDLDDSLRGIEVTARAVSSAVRETTAFIEEHESAQQALLYVLGVMLSPITRIIDGFRLMADVVNVGRDAFDGARDSAQWLIDRIYQLIEAINRIPTPGGILRGILGKLSPFAEGGIVAGGLSLVGERGPELVNLPRGTRVFSNSESRQIVGGSTQHIYINTVEIHGDPAAGLAALGAAI